MNPSDILMIIFTAVIAVTGVIGSIIFSGQLHVMKEQLDEMKFTTKISNDSLVKLQRAFVSVQQIRYLSHIDPQTNKIWWSFHVIWENSGTSPTRNLRLYVQRYLEDADIPGTFQFDVPQDKYTPIFLGPKGNMGSSEIHVAGDDLADVQKGKKFLYLWGQADYRDIFDNTEDHLTQFFVRVGVRGDPTKPWDQANNVVEMIFSGQDRHNCADQECYPNK